MIKHHLLSFVMLRVQVLFHKLIISYLIINFLIYPVSPAFGQVIPDGTTHTTITHSGNNTPVVNIAAPNQSGLSVNKYTDYNVSAQGMIINNGNLATYNPQSQSAIGGHVDVNPNLGTGMMARVILNEVTSNHTSSLQGTTEIFGQQADMIIANPNGITCAGCGFINTSKLTMITGSSNLKPDGNIQDFTMSPAGVLRIDGVGDQLLGLDTTNSAELISNAVRIAGKVNVGKDLAILTGNDKYSYTTGNITSKGTPQAEVAVDASALGAMTAGSIRIYASQAGFGVNTSGNMVATTDDLQISADGNIVFKEANGAKDIKITSRNGNIEETDNHIYAQGKIDLLAAQDIKLVSDYVMANLIKLVSGRDTIIDSNVASNTDLLITTGGKLNMVGGYLYAQDNIKVESVDEVKFNGESVLSEHVDIASGSMTVGKDTTVNATKLDIALVNDMANAGKISSENITFLAGSVHNSGNILLDSDTLLTVLEELNNTGTLTFLSSVSIVAAMFVNSGQLLASVDISSVTSKLLMNTGLIASDNRMILTSDSINNSGTLQSEQQATITTDNLTNSGSLVANKTLMVNAKTFNNTNEISGNTNVFINTDSFTNTGEIYSYKDLLITNTGNLTNGLGGGIFSGNSTQIDATGSITNIGKISAYDELLVYSDSFHNYGQVSSGGNADIASNYDFINYAYSGVLSGSEITFRTGRDFRNFVGAEVFAIGDITFTGIAGVLHDRGVSSVNPNKAYSNPYLNAQQQLEADFEKGKGEEIVSAPEIVVDPITYTEIHVINDNITLMLPSDTFQDEIKAGDTAVIDGYILEFIDTPNGIDFVIKHEREIETLEPVTNPLTGEVTMEPRIVTVMEICAIEVLPSDDVPFIDDDENDDDYAEVPSLEPANNGNNLGQTPWSGYQNDDNVSNSFVNYAGRIESYSNILFNTDKFYNIGQEQKIGRGYTTQKIYIKNQAEIDRGYQELSHEILKDTLYTSIPSMILAGMDLNIHANMVENRDSTIFANNALTIEAKDVLNITNRFAIELPKNMQKRVQHWLFGIGGGIKTRKSTHNKTLYNNDIVYSLENAKILSGGSLTIKAKTLTNLQGSSDNSTPIVYNNTIQPNRSRGLKSMNSLDRSTYAGGSLAMRSIIESEINLPVGQNGLFKVSHDPKYLVTANAPFLDKTPFVGGEYFFGTTGIINNTKFLGDPAYETRLMMDALKQVTYKQYLDKDIESDIEQMKRLYDNAASEMSALNLSVGMSLTDAQIANLKSDIIWYVEKNVQGQKVLVPEVYLSQVTKDKLVKKNGGLLYGDNVEIVADNLNNSSEIRANNILSIDGGTVVNLSGTITGDVVVVKADEVINATEVITQDQSISDEYHSITQMAGKTGTISGKSGIYIDAVGNYVSIGANLESDGDIVLAAGTATFAALELYQYNKLNYTSGGWGNSSETDKTHEEVKHTGSNIYAGGSFSLQTQGDATFIGSTATIGGEALFDVQGNLNVIATKDYVYDYSHKKSTSWGGLVKKEDTTMDSAEKLASSNVTVNDGLTIVSGKNTNVVGSNLNVTDDADIFTGYVLNDDGSLSKSSTGGSFNVLADYVSNTHFEEHKKTNALGGALLVAAGIINPALTATVMIGADITGNNIELMKLEQSMTNNKSTKAIVSEINIDGNLNIVSNGDVLSVGTKFDIGKDMKMKATDNIMFIDATDMESSNSSHKTDTVSLDSTDFFRGMIMSSYTGAVAGAAATAVAGIALGTAAGAFDLAASALGAVGLPIVPLVGPLAGPAAGIAGVAVAGAVILGFGIMDGAEYDSVTKSSGTSTITNVKSSINAENVTMISGNDTYIEGTVIAKNSINLFGGFTENPDGTLLKNKSGSVILASTADSTTTDNDKMALHAEIDVKNPLLSIKAKASGSLSDNTTTTEKLSQTTVNAKNINIMASDDVLTFGVSVNGDMVNMTAIDGNVILSDYLLNNKTTSFGAALSGSATAELLIPLITNRYASNVKVTAEGNFNYGDSQVSVGTAVNADTVNINSGNDTVIEGSQINSKNLNIDAGGNVIVKTTQNTEIGAVASGDVEGSVKLNMTNSKLTAKGNVHINADINANYTVTNNASNINSDNINIKSNDNVMILGSNIDGTNINIDAKNNLFVSAVYDQNYKGAANLILDLALNNINIDKYLSGDANSSDDILGVIKSLVLGVDIDLSQSLLSKSSTIHGKDINISAGKTSNILSSSIYAENNMNFDAGYGLTILGLPDKISATEGLGLNIGIYPNNNRIDTSISGYAEISTNGYSRSSIGAGNELNGKADFYVLSVNGDIESGNHGKGIKNNFKSDVIPSLISQLPPEIANVLHSILPNDLLPLVLEKNIDRDLVFSGSADGKISLGLK